MPLIHGDGLFDGERINACSVEAQIYYPRLMCASNGFGRLNLSYVSIVAKAFARWSPSDIPSPDKIADILQEYVDNRLMYAYESKGQTWGQWDSKKGTFGKYQTSEDSRSPAPPEPNFSAWLEANRKASENISAEVSDVAEKLRKNCGKSLEEFRHGVGVGVPVGVTCEVLGEKHSARPARGPSPNRRNADASAQTRHARIKELVMNWYREWAGTECPWGPGEGSNISKMLKSTPNWTDSQIASCLDNLARSDCVPVGQRPQEWICKLPSFLRGPLDQYWKSKTVNGGNSNGAATSKANAREQRIMDRLKRSLSEIDSSGASPLALPGDGRPGVCGLETNTQPVPGTGSVSGAGSPHAQSAKAHASGGRS